MDFTNTTKNPVVLSEKNRRFALDPGSGIHGYIRRTETAASSPRLLKISRFSRTVNTPTS